MLDRLLPGGRKVGPGAIIVLGLGRFGSAAAQTLVDLDIEVLGVDANPALVARYAEELTHVVQADTTDVEALRQLGAADFARAVVAIGDVEASIITVLHLAEGGVGEIWAKAVSRTHGEILTRVGAHHVVYPERSAGERVGHALSGFMVDYFEFEDGFAIARTQAPRVTIGVPLRESIVRTRYRVTVVGLKRTGEEFIYAVPETVPLAGDELIVSGRRDVVEDFCRLR
ncbi:TrkA family potassium uptake protein [Propioniciclava sp.]|uniref:potassium channel family protein n=1 Tax=Propioniciclava sp. TaxID=2038686 RepID=UPI00262E0846|nr:TrkA family potassium uptake protein [Propioniciclava sp.]